MDKNGKVISSAVDLYSLPQHLIFVVQHSLGFFGNVYFFTKAQKFCIFCWHLIFNFLKSYFEGDTGRICEGVPEVGFELLPNNVSNF